MKKTGYILIVMLLSVAYGQVVYEVSQPVNDAVKYTVTDWPNEADLWVFRVGTSAEVRDNQGLWFFSPKPQKAEKLVYKVATPEEADLIIFFVDSPRRAGWKHFHKRGLMW
ncbi:MAG: DUF6150 family protein [Bacteroidota bacterium]